MVENIDMKPVEGLTGTGAGFVETVRFAVVPQVLSNFASYALLRFEINVRGAGVMGFVGAGGIGQEFLVAIRNFYYTDVSAILVLIILTVVTIDLATERLAPPPPRPGGPRVRPPPPSALRQAALADLDGLRQRHPAVFRPSWPRRAVVIGSLAAIVALAVFAMIRLDFSLLRIVNGLHRLGEFAGMMLPPSAQGRFGLFLLAPALGETLAIAFLGTLTAACLAFPVAFLAARNVVPNPFPALRGAPRLRRDPLRRRADLGADLDQRRRPRAVRRALAIACSDFGALGNSSPRRSRPPTARRRRA